jgi:hypothetical protein
MNQGELEKAAERKLLEDAAKAISLPLHPCFYLSGNVPALTAGDRWWNPLCRAEDCAGLEAELLLDVVWGEQSVQVSRGQTMATALYAEHGGDRQRARQYACVLVAAALGSAL